MEREGCEIVVHGCSRNPEYYELIKEPIDLNTIEKNILTGQYTNVEDFEKDFLKLFDNVEVTAHSPLSQTVKETNSRCFSM